MAPRGRRPVTGPRPLYMAAGVVDRALSRVGRGVYQLGTGDSSSHGDDPRDCFGFAVCELYGLRRHRPGFNRGSWATIADDLNCDSAIEDADHAGELFERVQTPAPGVLLVYPTIRLPGHPQRWIGHIGIIFGVSRCSEWNHRRVQRQAPRGVAAHEETSPNICADRGHHRRLDGRAPHRRGRRVRLP